MRSAEPFEFSAFRLEDSVSRLERMRLGILIDDVNHTESNLQQQLTAHGIEFGEAEHVEFRLDLPTTPSFTELVDVLTQFAFVASAATGLAAYIHPELRPWPASATLTGLPGLLEWISAHREDWDLEITQLELGSVHVKAKPKGNIIKRVTSAAALTAVASLSQITGIQGTTVVHAFEHSTSSTATAQAHSQTSATPERNEYTEVVIEDAGQPRDDIIAMVPSGATVTMVVNSKNVVITYRVSRTPQAQPRD